jgi:predicted TIM-barrel fold metal-dependent hydrolase
MYSEYFIADCHIHGPEIDGNFMSWVPLFNNYDEYISYLLKNNIQVAVQSVGCNIQDSNHLIVANDHCLELAGTSKLKIIPGCILHPEFPEANEEIVAKFKSAGYFWCGELCPYLADWSLENDKVKAMFALLSDNGFILQLHCQEVEAMARIVDSFPKLPLVVSHLGGSRDRILQNIGFARNYPTVYLDICGSGHERLGMLEYAVNAGIEDQLFYGSDFPINEPGTPIVRVINGLFSDQVKRKILGENLRSLMQKHGMVI